MQSRTENPTRCSDNLLFHRHGSDAALHKTSHEITHEGQTASGARRGFSIQGREPTGYLGLRTKGQRLAPMWIAARCEGTAQNPVIVTHSLRVVPRKVAARPADTSGHCRAPLLSDASEQLDRNVEEKGQLTTSQWAGIAPCQIYA